MPNLKVTLWGKYYYQVKVKDNPSLHDLAMAISLEVHRKEGKTKFTGTPRTYHYIMECLLRKTAFNFRFNTDNPNPDTKKELYAAATELTNKTKAIKVKCPGCEGEGRIYPDYDSIDADYFNTICPKCNGHGFLIEKQMYRVGITFNDILVIDIDNHDLENLKRVKEFYETLLNLKFKIIKTNGGYWLFGDKIYNSTQVFKFAHCKVLNPSLEQKDMDKYIKALMALDKKEGGVFKGATVKDIKESGLFHGMGNFDLAFTFLSIKRERSTIRESKKHKDDQIEEVII